MANLFEIDGYWYGRVRKNGRQFKKSFKTKNRKHAERAFQKWLETIDAAALGLRVDLEYNDLAKKYAAEHLPKLRATSIKFYRHALKRFEPIFAGMAVADIASATLRRYVESRRPDVALSTVRQELAVLASMFDFAISQDWISGNIVRDWMRANRRYGLRHAAARVRYLTPQEETLIGARILALGTPTSARTHAAMIFAIETGLRWTEQFTMAWGDHRISQGTNGSVFVRNGKGGKTRLVGLSRKAAQILDQLPRHPTNDLIWFSEHVTERETHVGRNAADVFSTTADKLIKSGAIPDHPKSPGVHWHDLRRTYGCRLLQAGIPMERVSKALGHENISVTQEAYAFLEDEHVLTIVDDLEAKEPAGGTVVPLRRGERA